MSVRYKQAALGVLWALIQPVAQMVIFTVVFNRFAGIRSGGTASYPIFCLSGVLVWTMFAAGFSAASDSLVTNANLITKVYFPRVVLPVAAVVPPMVDFTVGFALLVPLMPLLGVPLRATLLLALPIAALAPLCAVAVGLWTSALNIYFRDVRYALPFFIQLLIFLTPVFYPPSLVPERFRPLLVLNPMAAVVEGFRAALLGEPLPVERLLIGGVARRRGRSRGLRLVPADGAELRGPRMTQPIVEARGVGKEYRLGAGSGYRTLRDVVVDTLAAPARWARGAKREEAPPFWALHDVSFDHLPRARSSASSAATAPARAPC